MIAVGNVHYEAVTQEGKRVEDSFLAEKKLIKFFLSTICRQIKEEKGFTNLIVTSIEEPKEL